MNFLLNNNPFSGLSMLDKAMVERERFITELQQQVRVKHGFEIPENAANIDLEKLGLKEFPIDLSDCNIELIESLDGQLIAVTTYHDIKAMEKDLNAINELSRLGTCKKFHLKTIILFDEKTAVHVRSSLKKAKFKN